MRKEKMVYKKFEIDFIKKFSLIIETTEADARTDAYNVLSMVYGVSARIIGAGVTIKKLPADVEPVRQAKEWAWYQFPAKN